MDTYTLKLISGSNYNLYLGTTLVSDSDLATLFGAAGSAYFVFDFNSSTPSSTSELHIVDSNNTNVMEELDAGEIKENYTYKGTWPNSAVAFSDFDELTGKSMTEAELSFLMGKIKDAAIPYVPLTTADYNWNSAAYDDTTQPFDSVALWKLPTGLYRRINNSVKVLVYKNMTSIEVIGDIYLIAGNGDGANIYTISVSPFSMYPVQSGGVYTTSNTRVNAYLSDLFDDGNSSGKTKIELGASTDAGSGSNTTAIGHYAKASAAYAIAIGGSNNTTNRAEASATTSVALGSNAKASGSGACALGGYGKASGNNSVALASGNATMQGQFDISTVNGASTGGYNNTQYRLISGVYDPQTDHDAATKGYVDGMITLTDTDPGEGSPLAAGKFIAVYTP